MQYFYTHEFYYKIHGSRDYFQLIYKKISFELVPILEIKNPENAKNITDVSPLHVYWVQKNIKKLYDDVRLLKQFFKANNIYGAESYINGFSGYICELLIIYYKGFQNTIKNIANWKQDIFIDIEKQYKNYKIAKKLFNPDKIRNPFFCNCGCGYTKEIFEELFDKFVKVELLQSILKGDKNLQTSYHNSK